MCTDNLVCIQGILKRIHSERKLVKKGYQIYDIEERFVR